MDFICPSVRRQAAVHLLICSTLILIGCAEVGAPPGGEEDKAAPFIISSSPANGATSVEPDNEIVLRFSERIVSPESRKAVFISPRPATEPKLKWKSDRLIITLPEVFDTDQTYIVSLSTDIVDLRRNRLDSTTVVAFSTGSTLDSGLVSGSVYAESKPRPGVLVALYDPFAYVEDLPYDSVYATYITQSTASGAFSFMYLPPREFTLIAFEDRNRDERFNFGREPFAVPDRLIHTGRELAVDNLNLTMTNQDTAAASIVSAAYPADGIVLARLSSPIRLSSLAENPSAVVLRPAVDSLVSIPGRAILQSGIDVSDELGVYAGMLDEGVYSLQVLYDTARPPLTFDSLRIKPKQDSQPPVVTFIPDPLPQFLERLAMEAFFSEPPDTSIITEQTFQLFGADGTQLELSSRWLDPLHLEFKSGDIAAGASYRLRVTEFEIVDLAGNTMGDSLIEYTIRTINPDSLGTVSGDIDMQLPDHAQSPVILEFTRIDNRQTFDLPVAGRQFKIDIPAGKYLANGFVDVNQNGIRDLGTAVPYRYSETATVYPDTIAVRARFETAGILIEFE
ncbi:MAG: Ig-like domain-containing protein [Candidatus Zixiibacteriota bacterium]|nr:MAG: Ig-like domain-containing protein [candidate division Zixibacteria bacterium]